MFLGQIKHNAYNPVANGIVQPTSADLLKMRLVLQYKILQTVGKVDANGPHVLMKVDVFLAVKSVCCLFPRVPQHVSLRGSKNLTVHVCR